MLDFNFVSQKLFPAFSVPFPKQKGECKMSLESIKEILETVCFYNTVNITQTFIKAEQAVFTVICVKNTSTLEVKNLQTQRVEYFDSVEEAAVVIERDIGPYNLA
jgi:hypothetical protein